MKTCAKCGHANKDEARFCGACGSKMEPPASPDQGPAELICPVCGSKNRPGVRFCGHCGAGLAAVPLGAPLPPPSQGAGMASGEATLSTPDMQASAEPAEAVEPAGLPPDSPVPEPPATPVESVAAEPAVPAAGAPALVTAPAEFRAEPDAAATCSHCGTVIRYCPCCGKPLAG